MKEKQLLIKSKKLSKKFIIVDGHIDLPYRLKEAGYLKKNKIDSYKNVISKLNLRK